MKSKYYKVVARVRRYWFCKLFVVYNVVCCYSAWYDPSYGNGGGDYRDYTKIVAKCGTDKLKAVTIAAQLNTDEV